MLKKPASKAAASEELRRTLWVRWRPERCENEAGGLFEHPEKKRPALVWNTETAIRTGWRSAILQSLKADCPALPSSSRLRL